MSRGNHEGSIYYDKSVGRYRAAVSLPGGKRRTVSALTREACAEKLAGMMGRTLAGLPLESADRLGTFLDWWIGTLEVQAASGKRSLNTVDNAKWAVNVWLKPYVGSKRLRELTPEDVEVMLNGMAAAKKSRRTIVRVRSYLSQALAKAQSRQKVSQNVASVAELPETTAPAERKSLTREEAKKVLKAANGDRLQALFVAALMLGLRPGELLGVQWSAGDGRPGVDLEAGTLEVATSLKRERGQLRIGHPKTGGSRRILDMPAPVQVALRAHRKRQLEERLAAGAAWQEHGLVFTTEIGTPIDPSNLRRAVRKLTTRAEVTQVSPNELGRHSAASLLSAEGVPLETVADLLGHKSTRMLEQTYRHRPKTSMGAHVAPMEGIFG